MTKRIIPVLLGLLLLLSCAVAEGHHLTVELPTDARKVEDVTFEDGDRIETWQLSGGASIQILEFRGPASLSDMIGAWDAPASVADIPVPRVDGRPSQGIRFLSTEGDTDYSVTVLRITEERNTYFFETVFPQRLGDEQIDAIVDSMIRSLHFT